MTKNVTLPIDGQSAISKEMQAESGRSSKVTMNIPAQWADTTHSPKGPLSQVQLSLEHLSLLTIPAFTRKSPVV